MQVLTFNSHQPYIHLLACALPWHFGVVTPRSASGRVQTWEPAVRPLPPNVRIYPSVSDAAAAQRWDWALVHNINDLLDTRVVDLPRVLLVHGTASGRFLQDQPVIDPGEYRSKWSALVEAYGCRLVYISELKRRDWGLPGTVVPHGIDAGEYSGYRGERRGVLLVSNHIRERGAMLGWSTYDSVCRDLPHLVIGRNPRLAHSRTARDWDDLREQYRSWRVFLYTPVYPFEDGYNMALLEAMATGMPVATLAHPTSPVRDGIEGIVASSAEELGNRLEALLDAPAEACRMGANARRRVESLFPISGFSAAWRQAGEAVGRANRRTGRAPEGRSLPRQPTESTNLG